MDNQLTDLSYDEWLLWVFDHPVNDGMPEWYFDLNAEWWDELADPALTVSYVTRAFENIVQATALFTDAQINQGLWFLLSNACSSHMFALFDKSVPLADRVRCVRAFYTVYEQLLAPRCSNTLGHTKRYAMPYAPGENPLDSVCYMWWDILPVSGAGSDDPDFQALDEAMLDVMEKTLLLPSEACHEGALHGLGHWARHHTEREPGIIDAYLARNPELRPELKQYALSARGGCVL